MSTKVSWTVIAGAVTLILCWALQRFLQLEIPQEVQAAFTLLLSAGLAAWVGYKVPEQNPAPSMVDAVYQGKGAAKGLIITAVRHDDDEPPV